MTVADFLQSHADDAFLVPEIATQLRVPPDEVERAIAELDASGLVCRDVYPLSDPHLPPSLTIVTWLAPDPDAAHARIDRVYDRWYRDFTLTHRCA